MGPNGKLVPNVVDDLNHVDQSSVPCAEGQQQLRRRETHHGQETGGKDAQIAEETPALEAQEDELLAHEKSLLSEDSVENEERTLFQSVADILSKSAQSVRDVQEAVKEAVIGNGLSTPASETGEEKSVFQSVGDLITHSAQAVKEAVVGSNAEATGAVEEAAEASILVHSAVFD